MKSNPSLLIVLGLTCSALVMSFHARADTILVTTGKGGSVVQFSLEGISLGALGNTGLSNPQAMARDTAGNLYLGSSGAGGIDKYSPTGLFLNAFSNSLLDSPLAFVFAPNGDLFATGYFQHSGVFKQGIERYSASGTDFGLFATVPDRPLQEMAFDTSGNLYVTFGKESGIEKYSPSGLDLGIFADTPGIEAGGLIFDPEGNLYVSYPFENKIEKFSPTGQDLGIFATAGLNNPRALTLDSDGNLYVANWKNSTLEKISPTGDEIGLFSIGTQGFSVAFAPTPEPASFAQFAAAAMWLATRRGRQKSA